jgi:hypothetical protein
MMAGTKNPDTTNTKVLHLQADVGEWAKRNFGENEIKFGPQKGCPLGSFAPLLGLSEETGELIEAVSQKDPHKAKDAIGDVGIYLLDYCAREDVQLYAVSATPGELIDLLRIGSSVQVLAASVGRLQRANLKRAQGIRNHGDDTVFRNAQRLAICGIMAALSMASLEMFNVSFVAILEDIAKEVVKRDWIAKPATAHEAEAVPEVPV